MRLSRFDASSDEIDQLREQIRPLARTYSSFEDVEFLKDLPLAAHQLPKRLVRYLNEFKYDPEEEGYCVVSTGLVDPDEVGLTPSHWELKTNNDTCRDAVMAMCLCAAVLGDLYGWLTQQDGRIVHDILPIKAHEFEQLGSGSKEELTWHTEDAFHELRGDYLLLMCLRNNDAVPTTLSRPDCGKLTDAQIDLLFGKHFVIKPDNSHKPKNNSSERAEAIQSGKLETIEAAYQAMLRREREPEKIAVLFGNKKDPCLRMDPYFMEKPDCPEAADALVRLIDLVTESLVEVALKPGEILIVDNYRAVHGRRAFDARFDGTDRWYKRVNVIRDVRRCLGVLENGRSRVVY